MDMDSKAALLLQNFSEKRCFLPNINTKIFATCPPEYTWNPDNVFSMLRHRNLTKGGYGAGSGGGGGGGYGSIETSYSNFSSSSHSYKESWGGSGSRRQEAVQMWPQEVNLKLRISKLLLLFENKIKVVNILTIYINLFQMKLIECLLLILKRKIILSIFITLWI